MYKSIFVDAGRSRSSNRSSTSYRSDDDCSIDEDLVERLESKRNMVMELMDDAEEKQFTKPFIKKWLVRLKHIIYDADTLLDRIETESRFEERYREDGSSASHDRSKFKQEATSKVKERTEKLVDLVAEAGHLGLKPREEEDASSFKRTQLVPTDRITSPVLSRNAVVIGREEEKEEILRRVLSSSKDVASGNKVDVIAIVGMGGSGKTTLARYVYNHCDVEERFERSWACVSDNYDLVRLTQAILELLTADPVNFSSLGKLQDELENVLRGERFLIVLDDVWDLSKQNWETLMAPFSTGADGSKIIVTTRDLRVAFLVSTDFWFELEPMSEDEGWSLFSNKVFGDDDLSYHPELEAIGKEIVVKCCGLPSAIETVSGILQSKTDVVEWERIRESSLWQLPVDRNDILPALRLSYTYLPSHLKACLAYCSLFPKDYKFSSEELAYLWIDEGFVHQLDDDRHVQDIGKAYFEDLYLRSFFTDTTDTSDEDLYVMHDVIHDLAQVLYADFHLQLERPMAAIDCKKIRHVSFQDSRVCNGSINVEILTQIKSLQTLMTHTSWLHPRWDLDDKMLQDFLLQHPSLRVLCLRGCRISSLPHTISNLKLLRHLDVSYTDVKELPTSLHELYHLQRLMCNNCDHIEEFQNDISAFVSLKHFTLSGKRLQKARRNLSRLSSVCSMRLRFCLPYSVVRLLPADVGIAQAEESVDVAVVDQAEGSDSGDTPDGSVDVARIDGANQSGLGDIQAGQVDRMDQTTSDSRDRESGSDRSVLHVQVKIDESSLVYLADDKNAITHVDHTDLFEALSPHRDIQEVCIESFNCTRRLVWMVDQSYQSIVRVTLLRCQISSGLMPGFGRLPSLKYLSLTDIRGIKRIGREFYDCNEPFGSLEELCFEEMTEWEEWEPSDDDVSGGICFFPRLWKLKLVNCPSLKGRLPARIPSLKKLLLNGCTSLRRIKLQSLVYLEELQIWFCMMLELESLSEERLPLSSSSDIEKNSPANDHHEDFPPNYSLIELIIHFCYTLKRLNGVWLQSLRSLKTLEFSFCRELEALPKEGLPLSLVDLDLSYLDKDTGWYWTSLPQLARSIADLVLP